MKINTLCRKIIFLLGSNKAKIKYSRKQGVKIGDQCTLLGRVEWGSEPYLINIGNQVRITSGCQFVTHDGGMHVLRNYKKEPELDLFGPITVGNNVFIGIRTIIMPGVTIGNNVVIGAGSLVTKDIPDNCVACGVPAKVIRSIEDYYCKARKDADRTKGMSSSEKKDYLEKKYTYLFRK